MKRIVALLICALLSAPVYSQEFENSLLAQRTMWDTNRIIKVLDEKINTLSNPNRYTSLVNYAKENYKMSAVYHAILSCKDSVIEISIVDNDFPLDIYYLNERCKVRLIVLTYQGEIEIVDTGFVSLMKGLAQKEANAFRFIIKQRPDLIFVCKDVFGCFFYVKNNIVYVYDYYNQEKGPLKEYSRLTEIISN